MAVTETKKRAKVARKPEPVAAQVVCSLCGFDWDKHGDEPTAETCVELLKAELARRTEYPAQAISPNSSTSSWADWYRSSLSAATRRAAKAQ